MSADKPYGWCTDHNYMISHEKYLLKCCKARQGKTCKHFTRKRPEWTQLREKSNFKQGGRKRPAY